MQQSPNEFVLIICDVAVNLWLGNGDRNLMTRCYRTKYNSRDAFNMVGSREDGEAQPWHIVVNKVQISSNLNLPIATEKTPLCSVNFSSFFSRERRQGEMDYVLTQQH